MRGKFVRGDGVILPNNVTEFGQEALLDYVVGRAIPSLLYLALANCTPSAGLQLENMGEPTIGENGYARIPLDRNSLNWPMVGDDLGVHWVRSLPVTWDAIGGAFSSAVTRVALVVSQTDVVGPGIIAVSAAFDPITITPATPSAMRSFAYQLYAK